jgi:hypothetical protein
MFNSTLKYQFQQLHRNKEYNLNITAEIRMFSLPHKKVTIIASLEEHFAQKSFEICFHFTNRKSEVLFLKYLKSLIFHD